MRIEPTKRWFRVEIDFRKKSMNLSHDLLTPVCDIMAKAIIIKI